MADRFGLWGPAGTPGVAWGSFDPFLAYTGQLLWYLPAGLVPAAGWAATVLEVALAVGLLAGVRLRAVALACGVLLSVFAITMTIALGPEPPLSYSVVDGGGRGIPVGHAPTRLRRVGQRKLGPAVLHRALLAYVVGTLIQRGPAPASL